jgi:hypothetical protein
MKYLIVLLLLVGCGIKPSARCSVDIKAKTVTEIKNSCVENTTVEIKKEF